MTQSFDLLGDPIPENHGKPGANGHVATAENVRRIRVLLVAGMRKAQISKVLGITLPTLNKHYFRSGKINHRHAREMALAEQRAKVLLKLDEAIGQGKVAAMKMMNDILAGEEIKDQARRASAPEAPKRDKKLPEGKKQMLAEGASQHLEQNPLFKPGLH